MAAVLACGEASVLSLASAAVVLRLLSGTSGDRRIHVSTWGGYRSPGPGVWVHRVARMQPDEITRFRGVPVTTPARTILDLAGAGSLKDLEQAFARAFREKLTDRNEISRLLERYPRRKGTGVLCEMLSSPSEPALLRSEAEFRFLALVREYHLPAPAGNAKVCGHEVDFFWRSRKLVVEVDGYAFHSASEAFEHDRSRDATLAAKGYRVMRVTWRQITEEPNHLIIRLAQALVTGPGA